MKIDFIFSLTILLLFFSRVVFQRNNCIFYIAAMKTLCLSGCPSCENLCRKCKK